MTLEFAWPWLFLVLPLPLLAARLPAAEPMTGPARLRFPFAAALLSGTARSSVARSRPRLWLASLAWLLLVIAAARPQGVGEPIEMPVSGRSLMLAVDISGSMQNEDMRLAGRPVMRLSVVKQVAGDFITRREGDRLGLILFGDLAYLQTPLTFDRETVRTLLMEAAIGLAGKGTALGDAIGLAVKRLRDQPEQNRVVILLTDGANTSGSVSPAKAAELAADEGVRIYTIGIGDDRAGGGGLFGLPRRPASDLDETTLRGIAEQTGGRYFRARDVSGLQEIYALIDDIEPLSEDSQSYRPVDELYAWPLAGALFCSLLLTVPLWSGVVGTYARRGRDA